MADAGSDGREARIAELELQVASGRLIELARFYGARLGLATRLAAATLELTAGDAMIRFVAGPDQAAPFYHFALTVPGGRFEAALAWVARETAILAEPGGGPVFRFDAVAATACYVHDPAGNIVELICFDGPPPGQTAGRFRASELAGVAEIGLVVRDRPKCAANLHEHLGLGLWQGDPRASGELAFVGVRGASLILAPPERPWLPLGRPAEVHPVRVRLSAHGAEVQCGTGATVVAGDGQSPS